jgi:hypothetical protein
MKWPRTSTPLLAAALSGAMALAFLYQGISKAAPPSLLAAAIFLGGAVFAVRLAMRRPHA